MKNQRLKARADERKSGRVEKSPDGEKIPSKVGRDVSVNIGGAPTCKGGWKKENQNSYLFRNVTNFRV